jgi:hypothetical protein
VGNDESAVRPLVASDLDWVVDLATRCGEQRQSFAPRFWRRAPDARQVHTRYLRSLIEDPSVPAMRTEHAFAIGMCRPGLLLVDDAAAEGADHWGVEGVRLLTRLAAGSRLRFVCPVPEPGRAALAARLLLTCVETWWHRDLPHRFTRSPGQESRRVRLVPAPPI